MAEIKRRGLVGGCFVRLWAMKRLRQGRWRKGWPGGRGWGRIRSLGRRRDGGFEIATSLQRHVRTSARHAHGPWTVLLSDRVTYQTFICCCCRRRRDRTEAAEVPVLVCGIILTRFVPTLAGPRKPPRKSGLVLECAIFGMCPIPALAQFMAPANPPVGMGRSTSTETNRRDEQSTRRVNAQSWHFSPRPRLVQSTYQIPSFRPAAWVGPTHGPYTQRQHCSNMMAVRVGNGNLRV